MRKTVVAFGLSALLLASCAKENKILSSIPPAEKRLRKQQCDTLEASFRPSRDRGGRIEIFGVSIGGRSATENRNSATEGYLFALNRMLLSCRAWERYEISPQEFRAAQGEFAREAQGPLRDAAAQQLLRKIANAFEEASKGGNATLDDVERRLVELETSRASPPPLPASWASEISAFSARFDRIDQRVVDVDQRMKNVEELLSRTSPESQCTVRKEWLLLFRRGSSTPDAERLAAVTTEVRIGLSDSPGGRISIIGFADRSGNVTANLSLARRRASQVGNAFQSADLTVHVEAAEGITDRFGDDPASNRAVVVSLGC